MTKFEAISDYTDARMRDTWMYYGGKHLPVDNLQFLKDDLFILDNPGGEFDGALIMSTRETIEETAPDWDSYERSTDTNDPYSIWTTDLHIIHPYLYCLLTAAEIAAIADPYDPVFIPFPSLEPIEIDDTELQTILLEAGVPFITTDELEFTREQILNLMIRPAMLEYFKWFPIITIETETLTNFQINKPIPSYAFGCQRAWVSPGYPVNSNIHNPLIRYFDEVMLAASSRGAFSNPSINYKKRQGFVDTNAFSTYILEKAVRQASVNYSNRTRIRVDTHAGVVRGYCNKTGMIEYEWAQYSNRWEDIPFNRQPEVRELAKAYVLRAFGMLRSQQDSASPGKLDYSGFIARADVLEAKVKDLWASYPKNAIIRG